MADRPKKSEQGEVNEPEETAAETSVGEQETPTERQLEREQAIVDEPVAESEQRIAEATAPEPAAEAEEDLEYVEETPRQKPAIPGMDLEVDIVPEGEVALGDRPRYSEDEDYENVESGGDSDDELPQTI